MDIGSDFFNLGEELGWFLRLVDLRYNDAKGEIYDAVIKKELTVFKEKLIEEWKVQAEGLTEANFYKKIYKNLEALNLYVKQEISNK